MAGLVQADGRKRDEAGSQTAGASKQVEHGISLPPTRVKHDCGSRAAWKTSKQKQVLLPVLPHLAVEHGVTQDSLWPKSHLPPVFVVW